MAFMMAVKGAPLSFEFAVDAQAQRRGPMQPLWVMSQHVRCLLRELSHGQRAVEALIKGCYS